MLKLKFNIIKIARDKIKTQDQIEFFREKKMFETFKTAYVAMACGNVQPFFCHACT